MNWVNFSGILEDGGKTIRIHQMIIVLELLILFLDLGVKGQDSVSSPGRLDVESCQLMGFMPIQGNLHKISKRIRSER